MALGVRSILVVLLLAWSSLDGLAREEELRGEMRRVGTALRSNAEDARRTALTRFASLLHQKAQPTSHALGGLRDVLKRRSPDEAAIAVDLLARVPEAWPSWLDALDPERDPKVFLAAVAAARHVPAAARRAALERARDERRAPAARALCMEALGRAGIAGGHIVLGKPLACSLADEPWVLASGRALGLRHLGDRRAALLLLDLLEHPNAAPRVHAWEGLVQLTGEPLGLDGKAWRAWFEAHPGALKGGRPEDEVAAGADGDRYTLPTPAHVPTYYGIPIDRPRSHVVFCLDVSQSMYGRGIEQAREELEKTLLAMPTTYAFDIVAFNERVTPFQDGLVPAHPAVKARALAWIGALETISYTNLYDAVETAFGYGGVGRRKVERPSRLDALFLLSDGAPNRGRYRRDKRVIEAIRELSQRRIPVHCVAAGEEVFPLLKQIADATGGRFADAFDFE